ncbi:MAG: purine-binding chemotaxis protein CheW [Planctomycetes bacterium]|nr:purine-binding chemotaxis protein CheW [Planctomycetota bacterium]
MTQAATDTGAVALIDKGGKYLTFMLAKETYGLEILKVREIIGMMSITAVPRTPDFVKGVINLRGKVIPVMDLRLKFNMDEAAHTDETCIIVVQVGRLEMGVIVDKVSEVRDIAGEEIEEAPQFGGSVDTDFILGMGKSGGCVTILLNIDKVISTSDLAVMNDAAAGDGAE